MEVVYSKTKKSIIIKEEDKILFSHIGEESSLAFIVFEMGKHTKLYQKEKEKFTDEQIEVAHAIAHVANYVLKVN